MFVNFDSFSSLAFTNGFRFKSKKKKHNLFWIGENILELTVSKEFNNNAVNLLKTNNVIKHKNYFQIL